MLHSHHRRCNDQDIIHQCKAIKVQESAAKYTFETLVSANTVADSVRMQGTLKVEESRAIAISASISCTCGRINSLRAPTSTVFHRLLPHCTLMSSHKQAAELWLLLFELFDHECKRHLVAAWLFICLDVHISSRLAVSSVRHTYCRAVASSSSVIHLNPPDQLAGHGLQLINQRACVQGAMSGLRCVKWLQEANDGDVADAPFNMRAALDSHEWQPAAPLL